MTNFKKILPIAIIFLLFFGNSVRAENIGIIDVEKVLTDSMAMKNVQEQIKKQQKKYQTEIDKKQEALKAEEKKIESKKNLLSQEAFEKEYQDFIKKVSDLQEVAKKREALLKDASRQAMTKINDEMVVVISEISQEKKLDLILPATQTLYYSNTLDISPDVLKKLNEKLPKVEVKFE